MTFIPGSPSYLYYGEIVAIEMILPEEEMVAMVKKSAEKDSTLTYGPVLAKALVEKGLSDAQIQHLRTIGFNTQDVLEFSHA